MDARGADMVVPVRDGPPAERLPLWGLSSGYLRRGIGRFPHVGTEGPWTGDMAYEHDVQRLLHGPVDDPALCFRTAAAARAPASAAA
jgi:monooxygenase